MTLEEKAIKEFNKIKPEKAKIRAFLGTQFIGRTLICEMGVFENRLTAFVEKAVGVTRKKSGKEFQKWWNDNKTKEDIDSAMKRIFGLKDGEK